mgnify:CR=1 FL=1
MVNAVEPSDLEETNSVYEAVNVDGLQKQGVLRPHGSLVNYSTSIDIATADTPDGAGFHILKSSYNYNNSETIASWVTLAGGSNYTLTADGSGGGNNAFSTSDNYVEWDPNSVNRYGHIEFTGTSLVSGTVYRYQFRADPVVGEVVDSGSNDKIMAFCALDPSCYTQIWNAATTPMSHIAGTYTGYFISNGVNPKMTFLAGGSTGDQHAGVTVKFYSFTVFKEIAQGNNEYQFLNRKINDSGWKNRVYVYLNGGDASGTPNTPTETITLGTIESGDTPEADYLTTGNSVRIYDSNFDREDNYNWFFGFHNAVFFDGCIVPDCAGVTGVSVMLDALSLDEQPLNIKRRLWISEPSALVAPNSSFCFVTCNGDMRNRWAHGTTTEDIDNYMHWWFVNIQEQDFHTMDYLIGLEYEVVKEGSSTDHITGTWNPAENSKAPTTLEKGVGYRFYASFVYDFGAQESELTLITKAQEQGTVWQGSSDGDLNFSAGNNDTFVHTPAGAHNGNYNTNGEIRLYFHDAGSGADGKIESFTDDGADTWANAPNHNLVVGNTVTIANTTNFNGAKAVTAIEQNRFKFSSGTTPAAGEDGSYTWVGNYIAREAYDCAVNFKPVIQPSKFAPAGWGMPERVTGVNYYYSSSKDSHSKKYKLMECDFTEGVKPKFADTDIYMPWKIWWLDKDNYTTNDIGFSGELGKISWYYSHSTIVGNNDDGYIKFDNPPTAEDWDGLYGMKSSSWKAIRFKTAAIVGSQAFYGNVEVGSEVHPDRILVSMSNHGYDMIPDDNYLEVTPDGDEIILLLGYQENLFIFKRNSLIVAKVGEEEDSVIDQIPIGGISRKQQACVTANGVVWANANGAFMHDGSELTKLTRSKIGTSNSHEQIDIQNDSEALP